MSQPTIHLVEDDPEIRDLVEALLSREGMVCETFRDAAQFWPSWERRPPDLVILDLMMPGEDGLSICRRIQGRVPVIIASARGEPMDRIIGLEIGADDYLSKPFEPRELVARIRALLRRQARSSGPASGRRLRFENWTLDLAARALLSPTNAPVELTAGEFDLLAALVRRPHQVMTRDEIMDVLKGRQVDAFDRSIDIQMSRLRRKLGDDPRSPTLIRTVRNVGYLFAADVEARS